jgi:N-acetylglucosamine-6-phosphate deacetylase
VTVAEDGRASLSDGTLAGSTLNLIDAVKNVMKFTELDLSQVLEMVTVNPSNRLGLFRKGRLQAEYDADFVVLDDNLKVIATYKKGNKAY